MRPRMEPILNLKEPEHLALPCEFRIEVLRWRKANKISWEMLGAAIGSSPATIAAVLRGYQICSYQVIRRLVAVSGVEFKCSLDTIKYMDDSRERKAPPIKMEFEKLVASIPNGVLVNKKFPISYDVQAVHETVPYKDGTLIKDEVLANKPDVRNMLEDDNSLQGL